MQSWLTPAGPRTYALSACSGAKSHQRYNAPDEAFIAVNTHCMADKYFGAPYGELYAMKNPLSGSASTFVRRASNRALQVRGTHM